MAHTKSAQIRAQLDHPVIDADGHFLELWSCFAEYAGDHGGPEVEEVAPSPGHRSLMWLQTSLEERRQNRLIAPVFWAMPADTNYWATVATPSRYYERLGEAGIDFSVLYPSMALNLPHLEDSDQRISLCRLFNEYISEEFRPYRDRFAVAAMIPMHTPSEAIDGLEHAHALGAKVALIPTYVKRDVAGSSAGTPSWSFFKSGGQWLDTFGIDSEYNYDPVWARAIELGLPLACHSPGMGFSDRASISNYMYNHIGHFAAAGEAFSKSLFFGGVTRRFPKLRVAVLEGGAAVGVRLYGDLVARWKKRGPQALDRLNPAHLDPTVLGEMLTGTDADGRKALSSKELIAEWGDPSEGARNDFALSGVTSVEDIRDAFCDNFYWGCEADDPLAGLAFDTRVTPLGAKVPAMMGSDIAHWDVPEFDEPLSEAYELVDRGLLDADDFRDFVYTNPTRCYSDLNPEFFTDTVIAAEAFSAK